MSVDESLMCSFQILKPGDKKQANNSNSKKVNFVHLFSFIFFYEVCELRTLSLETYF